MNIDAFARQVLRQPLWPHQLEAVASHSFITCIAAARRTGKTTTAEVMAMYTAFSNRACKVLVLSATEDAARRVTESIRLTLNANRMTRGAVVDDYATRISLTNGSEIISLPASQRQVRGYGKAVLLVILDEAGFMPSELWTAAHYTALDERANGSRILMLGSPWGGRDHFFRRSFAAGIDGDQDHASFHWTYEVNPTLDREYLERQRDHVSPAEYAAEVLGEWSDAAGSLFSRELLERQTADVELPRLGQLVTPARPAVAVDWGVSFDRSAAAILYRLPVAGLNPHLEPRPRFVVIPHIWPAGELLGDVVSDVASRNVYWRYVATETNGVGAMPSQELSAQVRRSWPASLTCTWYFTNTTAAKKTAGYGTVLGLLEQNQLVLPRHPDLLRQLAGLRFEQGERGFTRIEAENRVVHDDVADALMLAMLPHQPKGSSRIRCSMQTLASRDYAPVDAGTAELAQPIIETPGGLRLYARPPLQSVAGPEVSYPHGVRRTDNGLDLGPLRARVREALEHNPKETA
jgi:hypothetical protein